MGNKTRHTDIIRKGTTMKHFFGGFILAISVMLLLGASAGNQARYSQLVRMRNGDLVVVDVQAATARHVVLDRSETPFRAVQVDSSGWSENQ